MWRDMNDAQHMWIIGSFFQFSAGESWCDLKGYDLTPASSQGIMANLRYTPFFMHVVIRYVYIILLCVYLVCEGLCVCTVWVGL
jgi:hypothetical protein